MSDAHEIELTGCTPEPLMSYLKALGILRLVSEQADPDATACWRNELFVLRSKFDEDGLVNFFLHDYRPTPILVPWSGNDFFAVTQTESDPQYKKTPTGPAIIEAFLKSSSERIAPYRRAIQDVLGALHQVSIETKSEMEKNKPKYLATLRSHASDEVVAWIDSAAVILEKSTPFSALLGSGGGSDGNTHFSDNFMQNLWEMLDDFDCQRVAKRGNRSSSTTELSTNLLRHALFGEYSDELAFKRTSALYDSGAVGGPNATQGMSRDSLSNPWNIILLFEGSLAFGGALVRRSNPKTAKSNDRGAVFPFQFRHTVTEGDNTADKEGAGREVWLPLWSHRATWAEISYLLAEGRAENGRKTAQYGVDMARAAASLGIDRGISSFYRYAIVKGRVGGENYTTAACLGRFDVEPRHNVDLFRELDWWLDRFRRTCSAKETPGRFKAALRRIESAIFDYCRYGRREDMQAVLVALGRAERELAVTGGQRGGKEMCRPLGGLSTQWLKATHDGSVEFAVALALAGIHDRENKIQTIRSNIEPVTFEKRRWAWQESGPHVVWNSADLATNMAAVLERRMMDGARAGCDGLPLDFKRTVSLDVIAAFIAGEVDDHRIEELLWGLVLINHGSKYPEKLPRARIENAPLLPREYALLKLLFLPRPLVRQWDSEHDRWKWRLARFIEAADETNKPEDGIRIRPEPRVLPLLRAGRVAEACRIAYQRLRSSGLKPLPGPLPSGVWRERDWEQSEPSINPQRLAAALLLPVSDSVVNQLVNLVTRQDEQPETATHVTEGGEAS